MSVYALRGYAVKAYSNLLGVKSIALIFLYIISAIYVISDHTMNFQNRIPILHQYLTGIVPFGFAGAVLIAHKGEVLLRQGYGLANRETGMANRPSTVFNTGSISKQFTAALIMKLVMQGKLSPHDPISNYLGGVPEDKANITLHRLLTHTAGLIDYVADDYEMVDREEMLEKVLTAPLHFPPGEAYEYSNAGYSLLAAIVEIVSERPYETFLATELLQPAGLHFTGYQAPDWSQKEVAHWYLGNTDNGTPLTKPYPSWSVMGNGEILSTLDNLYQWHIALSGDDLLSAEAKAQMYTPFLRDYAYGWRVLETDIGRLIRHNGASSLGSSAVFQRCVDEVLVIIMFFNQAAEGGDPLCVLLDDRVTEILLGGDVTIPPEAKFLPTEQLVQYAGRFVTENGDEVVTAVHAQTLTATAVGQQAINFLAFPEQPLTAYANLNEEAQRLFETAVLHDDYLPFQQALGNDAARVQRYRYLFLEAIRENNTGAVQAIVVAGTTPSMLAGMVATHVTFMGEQGRTAFYLHWKEAGVYGITPADPAFQFTMTLQATAVAQFIGYDIASDHLLQLAFVVENGRVTHLRHNSHQLPLSSS
jgi:CubicO group peptidase (beta-lactamase class C family)